jgi:hypothetical protein
MAGCSAGRCAAAPSTTDCKPATCAATDSLGSVAHVGFYASVSHQAFKCDGATASAAGCKAAAVDHCNNLVCSGTACKTSCTSDADCSYQSYCVNSSCVAQADNGTACNSYRDCKSEICALDVNGNGPACRECLSGNNCTGTTPLCGDVLACNTSCLANVPEWCNSDGSQNCAVIPSIKPAATDCGSDGRFHCGGVTACPDWMICVNSTCKIAGGQRCLNLGDCATGACPTGGGRCPPTAVGGICVGDFDNPPFDTPLVGATQPECVGGASCSGDTPFGSLNQNIPTCANNNN